MQYTSLFASIFTYTKINLFLCTNLHFYSDRLIFQFDSLVWICYCCCVVMVATAAGIRNNKTTTTMKIWRENIYIVFAIKNTEKCVKQLRDVFIDFFLLLYKHGLSSYKKNRKVEFKFNWKIKAKKKIGLSLGCVVFSIRLL